MSDRERGLYAKYTVTKVENGDTVFGCFVLRPDKDRYSWAALAAYADACAKDHPLLAADLRAWLRGLAHHPGAATPAPEGE